MQPHDIPPSHPPTQAPEPTNGQPVPGARPACPYLGREGDPDTYFLQPHHDHRCQAIEPAGPIGLNHQLTYCYGDFRACVRFLTLDENGRRAAPMVLVTPGQEHPAPEALTGALPGGLPEAPAAAEPQSTTAQPFWSRFSFEEWMVYGVTGILLVAIVYFAFLAGPIGTTPSVPTPEPAIRARAAAIDATATTTATPKPTATPRPTRSADVLPVETVAVPTPPAGGLNAALSPSQRGVASFNDQDRLPAFGERNLHVGRFDGRQYLGGILFPLIRLPKGSRVSYIALELTGLSDTKLVDGATWTVELLDPAAADQWNNLTYETLDQAPATQMKTAWQIPAGDLAPRKVNVLQFSDDARDLFMQRLAQGKVAFRIRGPEGSADSLFTWDTGYGEGFGTRPILRVGFVPPPPTPGPKVGEPTAVPLIVWISDPTPAPTSTPLPGDAPSALRGMILFLSDRFGQTRLMVHDPATGRIGQVTQSWPYSVAKARQQAAAGVSVSVAGRTCGSGATPVVDGGNVLEPADPVHSCTQLVVTDGQSPQPREVTQPGYMNYDPAVAPDGQWIAYVSTITGNDELFKIRTDGSSNVRLTENVWEWDKHPSWSPDGSKIVFFSNRDGHNQLYVMNADGTGVENISHNGYNDVDPVWVP